MKHDVYMLMQLIKGAIEDETLSDGTVVGDVTFDGNILIIALLDDDEQIARSVELRIEEV